MKTTVVLYVINLRELFFNLFCFSSCLFGLVYFCTSATLGCQEATVHTMPFQVATYPGIDKSLLRLGWCFETRDQLIIIFIKFVHTAMHILDPLLNQDIA
jgi:hypothetical protein